MAALSAPSRGADIASLIDLMTERQILKLIRTLDLPGLRKFAVFIDVSCDCPSQWAPCQHQTRLEILRDEAAALGMKRQIAFWTQKIADLDCECPRRLLPCEHILELHARMDAGELHYLTPAAEGLMFDRLNAWYAEWPSPDARADEIDVTLPAAKVVVMRDRRRRFCGLRHPLDKCVTGLFAYDAREERIWFETEEGKRLSNGADPKILKMQLRGG